MVSHEIGWHHPSEWAYEQNLRWLISTRPPQGTEYPIENLWIQEYGAQESPDQVCPSGSRDQDAKSLHIHINERMRQHDSSFYKAKIITEASYTTAASWWKNKAIGLAKALWGPQNGIDSLYIYFYISILFLLIFCPYSAPSILSQSLRP